MKKGFLCLLLTISGYSVASGNINSINSLYPNFGQQGQHLSLNAWSADGVFEQDDDILFYQGSTVIFYSDPGNVKGGYASYGEEDLFAEVYIPRWVPVGKYSAARYQDAGGTLHGTCPNCFTVNKAVLSVTPNYALIGQKIKVDISGLKTHFTQSGRVWLVHESRQYVEAESKLFDVTMLLPDSVSARNDKLISAFLTIPDTIPHGYYDVYVSDNSDGTMADYESIYLEGALLGLAPNTNKQGSRFNTIISGIHGSFDTTYFPDTTSVFNQYLDVRLKNYYNGTVYADSVKYHSPDSLYASFLIPPSFDSGMYDLIVGCGVSYLYDDGLGSWDYPTFYKVDYYTLPNAFYKFKFNSDFIINDTLCVNSPISFSDNSNTCDTCGIIKKWKWYFGDGISDTIQFTKHTYAKEGNYYPTLVINSSNGCRDSINKMVTIAGKPKAKFYISDSIICLGESFDMIDSSTVCSGERDYFWDFGDGTSGNFIPQNTWAGWNYHNYAKEGKYKIKLVVRSVKDGSADSMTRTITVNPLPQLSFSFQDSVCANMVVQFTNNSTADSFLWDFDDGDTSHEKNPKHIFKSSYSYVYYVRLDAWTKSGCYDRTYKRITIFPSSKIDATWVPLKTCANSPVTVMSSSSDYDRNNSTFIWDFGDGYVYKSNDPYYGFYPPSHSYSKSGYYRVTFKLQGAIGCYDSINKYIYVRQPNASWLITDKGNSKYEFFYYNNPANSYEWDFGDGTKSNQFSVQHTYNFKPGWVYVHVRLIVTDIEGCKLIKDTSLHVFTPVSIEVPHNNIESLKIYPNPFASSINIELNLSSNQQTKIELSDLDGRLIKQAYNGILKEGKNELQVSCPLPSGVYILRIVTRGGIINTRVVKLN